jgi:hypothetical protein
MFCQHCGFEYTHKTNYCKSCGGNLTSSDKAPVTQLPTLKITGVFFVIAAFVLFSLMYVYDFYEDMLNRGIRGDDVIIPFLLGIVLIGAVAGLLSWQLSRVITTARKREDWAAKQERPTFTGVQPPAHLVTPADPIRSVVESPSVVEHTTRQMSNVYKSPAARE